MTEGLRNLGGGERAWGKNVDDNSASCIDRSELVKKGGEDVLCHQTQRIRKTRETVEKVSISRLKERRSKGTNPLAGASVRRFCEHKHLGGEVCHVASRVQRREWAVESRRGKKGGLRGVQGPGTKGGGEKGCQAFRNETQGGHVAKQQVVAQKRHPRALVGDEGERPDRRQRFKRGGTA